MKTLKERIEVEQAYLDAKDVESTLIGLAQWTMLVALKENRIFDWANYDYRIKQKARTFCIPEYKDGTFGDLQKHRGTNGVIMTDDLDCKIIKLQEILE